MRLIVTVNPNPFISELAVLIQGVFSMNIVIRLINKKGTVIRITSCTLKKGGNKLKIKNLERYATGNYHLEIKLLNGDLVDTIGLVKV